MSIVKGAERVGIARVGDQFWILPVQVTRSSHTAEVNNSLSKDNFVIKKIYFNEKTSVRINKHPSIAFVRIPSIKWKCFLRLSLSLFLSVYSQCISLCVYNFVRMHTDASYIRLLLIAVWPHRLTWAELVDLSVETIGERKRGYDRLSRKGTVSQRRVFVALAELLLSTR